MDFIVNLDHIIFRFVNFNLKSNFIDFYLKPLSYCDSRGFNVSFFIVLIISITILWKNRKNRFWSDIILLTIASIIGFIMTYFLKHYFERLRPLGLFGDKNVNTLFEKMYTNSFPSGHTEFAVALCTFMFMTVRKYWYLYMIFATGSGFYRIYTGNHFPYDVFMGALVGVFSSYTTITLFNKYSGFIEN
jgi:undecaprenyl-diphosphatase